MRATSAAREEPATDRHDGDGPTDHGPDVCCGCIVSEQIWMLDHEDGL